MFLEIKKTDQDTCTVALISCSKETLELFDSSEGVDTTSRSLRREIESVKTTDLQGRIPIFMEIQTNPELQKIKGSDARNIFLKQLHFDGSTVAVGKLTETSMTESSFGHVSEIMSYVKSELIETDENATDAHRFEVAARLRFFLDFCKKDNRWLRDPGQRDLVRTTAYQLIDMIEKNRQELIGDSHIEQGMEMTKIVYELEQVLLRFDKILPSTPDLSTRTLSQAELGEIEIEAAEETPELENIPMIAEPYVEVGPPFAGFSEDKAVESINQFAERCQELMEAGEAQRASYEAQVFVKTLPSPNSDLWEEISAEGVSILKDFQTMGEAITWESLKKPHSSFNEALTISMLNLHMLKIARDNFPDHANALSVLAFKARKNLTELSNSRISLQDKLRIAKFDMIIKDSEIQDDSFRSLCVHHVNIPQEILEPLVNLSEYSAIAAGDLAYKKEFTHMFREIDKIDFEKTRKIRRQLRKAGSLEFALNITGMHSIETACEEIPLWSRDLKKIDSKISFTAPAYAENVAEEISNRYTTELCPFGCSQDNCANYGGTGHNPTPTPKIARKGHQFFPLYMLYHFTGEYCSKLLEEGKLRPDEVRDLLLLQQTNRNAHNLYYNHHDSQGARLADHFQYADGFTEDDRRIQVISSLNIYLKHPNFFKQPALRWLLETKLFNHNAFALLLKDTSYKEHKPFLISTIKQLNREVGLAHANQDLETASYLVHLLDSVVTR